MVYNCSNNSIILSGLRTRLSASFTLKSFTPFFLHPLVAVSFSLPFPSALSLLFVSLSFAFSPPPVGFFLAGGLSPLLRFLPPFYLDPIFPSPFLRPPPSSRSIINPSIPSRSFHPHIIRACTHARSSGWFDFVPPLDARARAEWNRNFVISSRIAASAIFT